VLDLTHPDAYAHILSALDALLNAYPIAYLKWDHNRLLVEAGHQPSGRPAIHAQTVAVYRMMDELRARHPGLEIESCASGAGRVDLGILEHTQRVWGSDTNDPIERQQIHRGLELIVPPELIGAHIGPSPSHTTGRTHSLAFRAETAIWCHLGFEIDLRSTGEEETADLAAWVRFYKQHRGLLHTGTVVNADHPDPAIWISGVVSPDRSRALFGVAALRRSDTWPPGPVRLPGLDPDRGYRIEVAGPSPSDQAWRPSELPDWVKDAQVVPGLVLAQAGVQLIALRPESGYLISATAVI
jgi:alpha-galactosidase